MRPASSCIRIFLPQYDQLAGHVHNRAVVVLHEQPVNIHALLQFIALAVGAVPGDRIVPVAPGIIDVRKRRNMLSAEE